MAEPKDCGPILLQLLASPTIASKNWVYRQYDHMVQDGTVVAPGSDAAVIRLNLDRPDLGASSNPQSEAESARPAQQIRNPQSTKYLAFTTDCNATYCYLDPYEGGKIAVAEAARNLVCSGARPLAVTDNLNFGNPMKPEVFWQFRRCVEGISEACAALATPVTGGNVSFYNESPAGAIDPTPTIGMLGLIDDPAHITTQWFKHSGDVVLLLGDLGDELGGSEYLKRTHNLKTGRCPRLDLGGAKRLHDRLLAMIRQGLVHSAHDCSEGGLAVALAECCMSNGAAMVGADIDLSTVNGRIDAVLFGESQSRVVVSCAAGAADAILAAGVPGRKLGRTGGRELVIRTRTGRLTWAVGQLRDGWWNSITRLMEV